MDCLSIRYIGTYLENYFVLTRIQQYAEIVYLAFRVNACPYIPSYSLK